MSQSARVILSGFSDEAAYTKTAIEQFSIMSALGMQYYSLRFMDVGQGIKNVMSLTKAEITKLRHLESEYGMNVASIGSPIGKVKLKDIDDGTTNEYIPFKRYLKNHVAKVCELAHAFETKLVRGFSFYPPKGSRPEEHLPQVIDQIGQMVEAFHRSDLTFGLEVEANLVGQNGELVAEIHRHVNHPALVTIFDGANLVCQGYSTEEVARQYLAMKPSLGWMHIKDYRRPRRARVRGHVDEDALKNFVPADRGDSGHEWILRDFAIWIPKLERKLQRRGIPGVFMDLEPHIRGGGQFGGTSGPDGMGVALRSLARLLDYVGIGYDLYDFDDIRAARGF
ncbi:MAG: sugar phosphate isomerase/epimerase [Pirellulales bacterium]|nr:sugar phosphate isomerase/epimerase [Pirellulales bacterium]